MKKSVFFEHGKGCFCLEFCYTFGLWWLVVWCLFVFPLWFVFECLVKLQMCLKCLFVFVLFGVFYFCLFGFGRFRVRWGPKGSTSPSPCFFLVLGVCVPKKPAAWPRPPPLPRCFVRTDIANAFNTLSRQEALAALHRVNPTRGGNTRCLASAALSHHASRCKRPAHPALHAQRPSPG